MEITIKVIAGQYWAYACPRCDNGTMAWEKDKADSEPYLKCILCGEEWHREKFLEKRGKMHRESGNSEANPQENTENKPEKRDKKRHKWQFGYAQNENK